MELPKREELPGVNIPELRHRLEELRHNAIEVESQLKDLGSTMPDSKIMALKAHLFDLTQAIAEQEAEYRRATTPKHVQKTVL